MPFNFKFKTASTNKDPSISGFPQVQGVSAIPPLLLGGTHQMPTLALPAAQHGVAGYLTGADWDTFNGKQPSGAYLTAVSGGGPLSFTGGTTPMGTIAKATASIDGYLAAADFTVFLAKVPPTRQINGQSLSSDVTLTTTNIADALNKRYVTDSGLVTLAATSGTNTGDQTSLSLSYSPVTPSNWSGTPPANTKDALDRLAQLLFTLSGGPIP